MSEAIVYNPSESTYLSINPSIYLSIYLPTYLSTYHIYIYDMGVSLNGGTPKTPQNDHF